MSQSVPFAPSKAQCGLLDWIHAHPECNSIEQICAESGTPRSTYYYWCAHDGFRAWFTTAWSSRLLMDGVLLISQARCNSATNYRYWKAIFDLTFDPKGLASLQHWQRAAAAYPEIDPPLDPGAETEADPCPTPAQSPSEQNQQPTSGPLDKIQNSAITPAQQVRIIKKALRAIAASVPPPHTSPVNGAPPVLPALPAPAASPPG